MTDRHHEILFYHNMEHIKSITKNEKVPLLLEMLSIVFEIDLTNLHILNNQYLGKIKPSLKDIALMARDLGITVRRFPIQNNYGYRLIRENKEEVLTPVIYNEGLQRTLREFNMKYLDFGKNHLPYINEIVADGSYRGTTK